MLAEQRQRRKEKGEFEQYMGSNEEPDSSQVVRTDGGRREEIVSEVRCEKVVEVVSLRRCGWLAGRHRLGASGALLPFSPLSP